jgi:hypothetical protein
MARTSNLKLYALWRERVRRQAQSRLTIAQFCAREHLSVASFNGWKRRFRLMGLSNQHPELPAPRAFLPVAVRVVEHTPDESLPIEADLPNGIRLRIPTANQRLACRLVRVVARPRTHAGCSR